MSPGSASATRSPGCRRRDDGRRWAVGTLFLTRPGQVVALDPGDGDSGLPLAVDGISGSWFPAFRAILTACEIALDGNFQHTHTLRNVIHVYAFGDRISQMRVSGICFAQDCGGGVSGLESVLGLYAANRIAARPTPVQLQVGTTAAGRFRGNLTGFRGELARAESRLANFSFGFHVFPGA